MDPNQLEVSANEPSLGGVILTYGDIFRNLNQKSYEIHFQILQPPYSLQKNWQGSISFFPQISSITWGSS